MAKSIDEMAKIECCNDVDIAYFKYGANAVLEIFKEIIENRNFCAFPKAVHPLKAFDPIFFKPEGRITVFSSFQR